MGSACFRHKSLQSFAKKFATCAQRLAPDAAVAARLGLCANFPVLAIEFRGRRVLTRIVFPALVPTSSCSDDTGLQQLWLTKMPGADVFHRAIAFREVLLGKFCSSLPDRDELALCIAAFCYRVGTPSAPIFSLHWRYSFTVVGQLSIANWSSLVSAQLTFGQIHGQRQSRTCCADCSRAASDRGPIVSRRAS